MIQFKQPKSKANMMHNNTHFSCRHTQENLREIGDNTPFCILRSTQIPFAARLLYQTDQGHGLLDRFLTLAPCCLRLTPQQSQEATQDISGAAKHSIADIFLEIARLHDIKRAYQVTNYGQLFLAKINEQLISEVNDAIREGR